jgi:signal transduction histidine kinase
MSIRLAIVAGMLFLYVATFRINQGALGDIGAALITVPVAVAGWYFGRTIGLAVGLASIILNSVLIHIAVGNDWFEWLVYGWPGNLMLLTVGYGTGVLKIRSDRQKQIEAKMRARERYLTLVKLTTSDILNVTNLADRNYSTVTHFVNLFVADNGYLVRWDATRERASLITSTITFGQSISDNVLESGLLSIADTVMRTQRILAISDLSNSQYITNSIPVDKTLPSIRSVLGIPLFTKEYMFVVILEYSLPRQFTPEELDQAQQMGDQVALVLRTVYQEMEIQKRLREANALSKIGSALSETERIGPNTVLQLIVESAQELIPHAEQTVIHLLGEDEESLILKAKLGFSDRDEQDMRQAKMQLGEGVAGLVIKEGITINVGDVYKDPRFLNVGNDPSYHSLLVAPIQFRGKQIGTISVQSGLTNAFTDDESRLLSTLGTQAAIVFENAHLLESTQQSLKESNSLYRINQKLVASLDPQELLQDVVELLQKDFEYYHVQIYIFQPESGDFIMHTGSGDIGQKLKETGYRLRAGEGIVGHTAETGLPFFTNNVDEVHFFIRNPLLSNTKSELAVPVKIDGHVMGVLDIQQIPPRNLGQRDLQLVSAVSDQLAISLQKANLYADLQASLQTEKAMRNQLLLNDRLSTMGRLLASVSHELNNPLQAIQNALFLLREEKGISSQGRQDLDIVLAESERMAALISRLRATYRPIRAEDFQQMQLNDVIEDVYALISTHLRHNEISFEFFPDPYLPVIPGLPDQIRQVILNLLMNAVEAMPESGRLTVATEWQEESDEVLLRVTDTGTGINPVIMQNIFEAFVTNKDRGTGLGLTIVYDIVNRHRGRIQAWNNPELGATFSVWLPAGTVESK